MTTNDKTQVTKEEESGPAPAPAPLIKVKLSPVEETMILTLWSRARDAASPNPVLGDVHAQKILDRVDADSFSPTLFPKDSRYHNYITVRAKQLDEWCKNFLKAHKNEAVTVLHLACGLDLRAMRLRKYCGVDVHWIDLDKPEVVNLRRRLIQDPIPGSGTREGERDGGWNYTLIGASVSDGLETWSEEIIPHDRPLLVIAEGLFPYLTEQQGTALLRRLVKRASAGGQVVLDTVGTILTRFQALMPLFRGTSVKMKWGVDEGQEVARAHPRLYLAETVPFQDLLPGLFASAAPPCLGVLTPVFSLLPSWRTYGMLLRLEF
ncbi:S-adenosyl-L-methionine-dependent methyltransferase [Xylariaceae sp. AK1471]|nr:S-adenosyl-L-methionine-dependent methyltransferase [Xylariaceae sp. AK1471]